MPMKMQMQMPEIPIIPDRFANHEEIVAMFARLSSLLEGLVADLTRQRDGVDLAIVPSIDGFVETLSSQIGRLGEDKRDYIVSRDNAEFSFDKIEDGVRRLFSGIVAALSAQVSQIAAVVETNNTIVAAKLYLDISQYARCAIIATAIYAVNDPDLSYGATVAAVTATVFTAVCFFVADCKANASISAANAAASNPNAVFGASAIATTDGASAANSPARPAQ